MKRKRHVRISRVIELMLVVILGLLTIESAIYYIATDNINVVSVLQYILVPAAATYRLGKLFFVEMR